ncbi:MAG TPA: nucleotidyl transferase AbiEii/AbiGii toxin family protein [bacterium]
MFEEVLPVNAASILQRIAPHLKDFYLAGGTGLALQLGHRKSADFDFFNDHQFNIDLLISRISPDKILMSTEGTLHCESDGIKLSFLYYNPPRLFPAITWQNINLADWRDISAEKMKAISQRGSKKDFVDLYVVIKLKSTIEQVCQTFKDRFSSSTINYYHVLRSLTFFEEAEEEPAPVMVMKGVDWEWKVIKEFFLRNIQVFEKQLSS